MKPLHPSLADWHPPASFEEVPSSVDGVLLWAPRPEQPEQPETPRSFKCPKCGAATGFDPSQGGLHCPYCGHVEQASGATVGTAAENHEFTLEAVAAAQQGWGVTRRELHCDSCGTSLAVEESGLSATCPFCASNQVALRDAPHEALRPKFVLPFATQPAAVAVAAKKWLGKGWMHPGGLGNLARVESFTGVYLSYWTFSANIDSKWRAEVGYERTESYYDSSSKQWKTRTVIDWRWQNGLVTTPVVDLRIPGAGSVSRKLLDRLDDFDLTALAEYSPDFLAGWKAQAYDVNLPDAWVLGRDAMRERAKTHCRSTIHSDHVRSFSMTADFEEERWRYVLLPVYISAYRFNQRVYQVMVNGQTGTVAGQKPVAWWKIWGAIALLWTPSLGLGFIGLILLVFGIGIIPLALAFGLMLPAFWFSLSLYRKAVESEAR